MTTDDALHDGRATGLPPELFTTIDHVGIAVPDLDEAIAFYADAFGMQVRHQETNEEQGVREAMVGVGDEDAGQRGQQLVQGGQPFVEGHAPEGATDGAGKPTSILVQGPASSTSAASRPSGATAATSPGSPEAGIRWP